MNWVWPLRLKFPEIPTGTHAGAFGAVREHDRHTGVDLYCARYESVYAVEAGRVVRVLRFTGAPESPWWNPTWAVMVEGDSGVVLYGELHREMILVGEGGAISEGEQIGLIDRVLRHDKGLPMDMLHMELYAPGTRDPVWWKLDEPQPAALRDPTFYLTIAKRSIK